MADQQTEKIIGAAIEVHRRLGPGFLESVYEKALCHELGLQGIPFNQQVEVRITYKEQLVGKQRLDLIVDDEVIVEIKALDKTPAVATAQVLSYLRATNLKRALIINFGEAKLTSGIKRISL